MYRWRNLAVVAVILLGACAGGAVSPRRASAAANGASPATGMALFAGTSGGTIVRTDSGTHWHNRQNLNGAAITALAAGRDGRTLYAATAYVTLWRSIDAGNHWTALNAFPQDGAYVDALAVNPRNPAVVYVGANDGIYQTTDGGASWLSLSNGLPADAVQSLAIDSHDPASVWAGTDYSGLYHSADGGSTWAAVNEGVLSSSASVQAIALSPASSDVIYVGTNSGLYQSVDGGVTWLAVDGGFPSGVSVNAVAVSLRRASRVYAGTDSGPYVSDDGGSTWSASNNYLSTAIHALAADPQDPARAYAGTSQGVYRTTDGGASWYDWNGDDLSYDTDVPALIVAPVQRIPSDPAAPACCGVRFFSQTNHNLSGAFLSFWQHNGGVDVFGYPRTEQFMDGSHVAQYTDRFELLLVNGQVTTAPLGRVLTAGRYFPDVAPFPATHDRVYFASTGHSLSGRFLRYWQTHHGALLLGAPIAETTNEQNGDGTGRVYQVQWFEKGRLEYHAELAGTRYEVELGLLGKQALQRLGWLP